MYDGIKSLSIFRKLFGTLSISIVMTIFVAFQGVEGAEASFRRVEVHPPGHGEVL